MSETTEHPRNTNIVPNYESFIMLRINEIAEAINHHQIISALEMLKTFYTTLPDTIKTKLKTDILKIEIACDLASQQKSVTAFQTMLARTRAYQQVGNIYILPLLDTISHELYLGGYMEKNWGPQTKKRDLSDIAQKLREGNQTVS